jgi:hypothetical protein
MNANERVALERGIRQARPGDIAVVAVSSVGGSKGIRAAFKELEASATKFQKAGSEVLLIAIKR